MLFNIQIKFILKQYINLWYFEKLLTESIKVFESPNWHPLFCFFSSGHNTSNCQMYGTEMFTDKIRLACFLLLYFKKYQCYPPHCFFSLQFNSKKLLMHTYFRNVVFIEQMKLINIWNSKFDINIEHGSK